MCSEAFSFSENEGILVVRSLRAKLRDMDADSLTAVALAPSDGPRKIIIDLTRSDFTTTAVLSALTRIATEHRLRLVGVSAQLDRLFAMLGIRGFFHCCDTYEDALADLGGS
jgi:anti-anti-sigma regulatory factor